MCTTAAIDVISCLSDKHWCALDWSTFREIGLKCDDDQLTPIYSEYPVLELPSCSLIAYYQFIGKNAKKHALMVSGNNPALLRNFREGLKIEVCSFCVLNYDSFARSPGIDISTTSEQMGERLV